MALETTLQGDNLAYATELIREICPQVTLKYTRRSAKLGQRVAQTTPSPFATRLRFSDSCFCLEAKGAAEAVSDWLSAGWRHGQPNSFSRAQPHVSFMPSMSHGILDKGFPSVRDALLTPHCWRTASQDAWVSALMRQRWKMWLEN